MPGPGGQHGWGPAPNPYHQPRQRKKSGCGGCLLLLFILFILLVVLGYVQLTGAWDWMLIVFDVPGVYL